MVTLDTIRQLALKLPEVTEEPHFEKISFRVKNKIFATYNPKTQNAVIKLSLADQDFFSCASKKAMYPVENKWGQQGWTNVDLINMPPEILEDVVQRAYCIVAPKKLAEIVKLKNEQL